jgi:hypothetical protein
MAKKYPKPTKFTPVNPEKYIGDPENIVMRSSWERKFAKWADKHPGVSKWFSEEMCVQYISPLDGKLHRYFPDFGMVMSDGKRYVVEIKPHSQSVMPKQGNKKAKTYLAECATYSVNQAKWKAAKAFFDKQGIKFIVVTEYELGLKKR